MRGEHLSPGRGFVTIRGSSPHARGTLTSMRRGRGGAWDHPRMRGEHLASIMTWARPLGSSPHARGTRIILNRVSLITRIIPACAGNTAYYAEYEGKDWDHPRMRGEHFFSHAFAPLYEGSSPHARGTRRTQGPHVRRPGIIPACAGNTRSTLCSFSLLRDHPRMRGEHYRRSCWCPFYRGSSPHARGTPLQRDEPDMHVGIIPACAGNT